MARIRALKPEYWSSPGHRDLRGDPWARLLFMALWNWADDNGRGTANARELAGFAFPHDEDITSADIRRMLGGIRRAFGVVFYEVDGRPYYAIPSWERHQKIDKRSGGRHPAPEEGQPWDPDPESASDLVSSDDSPVAAEPSEGSSESPSSTRREPGAGTGEQGNRGEPPSSPPPAATVLSKRKPEEDPDWIKFWSVYPRKVSKQGALKRWTTAIKTTDPAVIIAGAERYAADVARRQVERDKIKHPDGWLNDRRWEDDLADAAKPESISPWAGHARNNSGRNLPWNN